MDSIWEYLAARLSEPSTWVSLGSLATAVGFAVSPENWQMIAAFGMGLGGFIGTVLRERKKTTPTEIQAVVKAVVEPQAVKTVQPSPVALEIVMKNGSKT